MNRGRFIAICADDFGLSHGVSAGILEALEAKRLTAVSAMVNMPRWPAMGRDLLRHARQSGCNADIGLHLNLTLGRALGSMQTFAPHGRLPKLGNVIQMALRGRLPLAEIRAELARQFDRFQAVMERPPDHVDGHQHVHA
ncbi:MAG: ChbG/HpnK family deacetylase, partial [Methylocystis sp.]|nr:ChbG/HpnK family deacetylase [Methylocystis sp.]